MYFGLNYEVAVGSLSTTVRRRFRRCDRAMAHAGAYRTAAARASQYRLELDHLKHSRDNAMRREHDLEV